ncbi:hypothetical protein AURDEDRAFT_162588 [Auricularia subglabra TFB-10046 SS5]|nr:hypothetical protein AURDEDRAFT_162588 [Auricularia subglabra TFB-10046 SS5]
MEANHLRAYREKTFIPYCANAAKVFTRTGAQLVLPHRTPPSFNTLCSLPGSTFVDKSEFLHLLLSQLAAFRVGIIRRPRGFGKTTFLSMFDAFFDPLSRHAYLPSAGNTSLPIFQERNQLLVYALDFARLPFKEGMCADDLVAACDSFMDAAAREFYTRYQSLLRVQDAETSRPDFAPTFLHIIRWAKRRGWKLCFTIDNYTAPVLEGPNRRWEWSISEDILNRLGNLVSSRFILYGLILGDDVPHATQWRDLPAAFKDLTDTPALAQAIGFTVDDVVALGQAVSVDLIRALPSGTPTGRYAKRVYAAADIMTLARSVTSGSRAEEPALTKVRTFKHPPPAKTTDRSSDVAKTARSKPTHGEVRLYDIPMILDNDDDGGPGPFDDDGYEGVGDRSLPLPDLTDGSSGSSSSGSSDCASDGRSSAPSSGGDKDKIRLLPVIDEPSSPLKGYDKRPWGSDGR